MLKIKVDAVVKNVAVYIMLGVSLEGRKEIIGFWMGESETTKYWLTVLNDIKKRGVEDILIFAIDGLNGFNQAIEAIYAKAETTLHCSSNPLILEVCIMERQKGSCQGFKKCLHRFK